MFLYHFFGYPTGLFISNKSVSFNFNTLFKVVWSIVARGTVASPNPAHARLMFWQTMPISTEAISLVPSLIVPPKRAKSAERTIQTGAVFTKSCPPATGEREKPFYKKQKNSALFFLSHR